MGTEQVTFNIGEVIVNEGEHSYDLYKLISGTVSIFKGTTKVTSISEPGELLGEMSFFIGKKRSATMVAETNVELERISKDGLADYFKENPDFAINISESLAKRLQDTTQRLTELERYKKMYDEIVKYAHSHPKLLETLDSFEKVQEWQEEKLKEMLNKKSLMSQKIIRPFVENTVNAVQQFLNTHVGQDEPFAFGEKDIDLDAASVVNLLGEFNGWYVMAFPKDVALAMTSKITGKEYDELNEDVVNYIKEINNIIIGWIIGAVKGYKFSISTPTAIFGADAVKNMISETPSMVIPFKTEFGEFYTIIFINIMK
ncbi:MAG: cyclic nucleotide-binding domain-containing protein [Candidatus Woesearchaeota archaeon]